MAPGTSRRRRRDGCPSVEGLIISVVNHEEKQQRQQQHQRRRYPKIPVKRRNFFCPIGGRTINLQVLGIAGLMLLGGGWRRLGGVSAQEYIDGGKVSMDCEICSCEGSSDDIDIVVFDNPSSGKRVSVVEQIGERAG